MNKALLLVLPLLLSAACSTDTVGAPCTGDGDCQAGQTCLTNGFVGGFCTRGCTIPGQFNECPGTSICTETSDGITTFCSPTCGSSSCRESYTCAAVPGDANDTACRP
jgi:hypothetical protein